jgi:PhnB protein
MQHINAYLTFNGNCREAMTFYQECLGGDLYLLTIGESPMAEKMPPFMKEYILHATLTKGNLVIMASDMVAESGLIKGNNVSLMLNCCTENDINTLYNKLAEGGQATHPLEETFWDAIFGNLIDKFGNYWLLNFDRNQ